ncbi:MAG: hypothetical protein AAFV88_11835 [Planctomycetota bacterium]
MKTSSFHLHVYGPRRASTPTPNCIPSSFEATENRLREVMPSVLFEPDGSIAWASPTHQIVGIVYDANTEIQYVELRGHCSGTQLVELVSVIAGTTNVSEYGVMVLPSRQWKNLQTVARSMDD